MDSQKQARLFNPRIRTRVKPGSGPGTYAVDPTAVKPRLRLSAYGPDYCSIQQCENFSLVTKILGEKKYQVAWLDVIGVGDLELIKNIGYHFGIHPLVLEDVLNSSQRPKVEEYGDNLFIVVQHASSNDEIHLDQISMFAGPGFVVSFHQQESDIFSTVRERIEKNRDVIRKSTADYLVYSLIDCVIDHYFPLLDHFAAALERLEDTAFEEHSPAEVFVSEIRKVRHQLFRFLSVLTPTRAAVGRLLAHADYFITEHSQTYLKDCYDHTLQLIDQTEAFQITSSDLMHLFHARVAQKMNEIIKVLTIITTIFIPLSFIAGIYGMNFNFAASPLNMPELHWYYGYPAALTIMLLVALIMLVYFQRKGWISLNVFRKLIK